MASMSDPVNHPSHYHSSYIHESCGTPIECIDVVRHLGFDEGNAVKYVWRAGKKNDEIEDLEKAIWYLNDRVSELKRARRKAELAEQAETNRTELLETLHGAAERPTPLSMYDEHAGEKIEVVTGIECDYNSVRAGAGSKVNEFWVLTVYDKWTANEVWAKFNQEPFFLNHPQRPAIRDAILTLITRLPTSAYDGLASWVREAADEWTYAEAVRKDEC
jgi:hypothetical protein